MASEDGCPCQSWLELTVASQRVPLISFSSIANAVNRVRRTALALAKAEAEPVDMLIVELAALFHDLTDGAACDKASARSSADVALFHRPRQPSTRPASRFPQSTSSGPSSTLL